MAVPKYKTSSSKRDMRRSHHALKAPSMSLCSNCQSVKRPHTMCQACGHYNNKSVMPVKTQPMDSVETGTTSSPTE